MSNLEYRKGATTEDLHKNVDTLNAAKTVLGQLDPWFKGFVQDKDIDLKLRWKVFMNNDLGHHDSYYHHPDGLDWKTLDLYSDFHLDKFEDIEMSYMYERALEKEFFTDDPTDENNIAFKEYVLSKYLKSFTNDW